MFGLDEQISLRGRITTILGELDGANRANMMLHQYSDASNGAKYEVYLSDRPGNTSDTRAWEVSKVDFDYLREQGIPNAFGRS
jgi:hypothetical protein